RSGHFSRRSGSCCGLSTSPSGGGGLGGDPSGVVIFGSVLGTSRAARRLGSEFLDRWVQDDHLSRRRPADLTWRRIANPTVLNVAGQSLRLFFPHWNLHKTLAH